MHCKYCGYKLKKKDKTCPNCEYIFGDGGNNYSKKGSKFVPILLIVLLFGVIIGGYYYVNRPEVVFNLLLNEVYESASNEIKNYNQVKTKVDFNINVDMGEEYKDITNLINDFKISSSVNMDLENNSFVLGLSADYKNKSLLGLEMYYENNKAYIDLKDLFNKLIEVDVEMEETTELDITESDINIIVETIFNAVKDAIHVAEYSTSKEELDGVNVNKNKLIINNQNKDEIVSVFIDYLLDSNEFIESLSKIGGITNEEVINTLTEMKNVEKLEQDIYFSVYTKKLTNDFIKFEIGTKEKVVISYTKVNDKEYKMEMNDIEGTNVVTTMIDNGNNTSTIISEATNDDVRVKLTLNMSYVFNEKIQTPLTKEKVSIDELTEEDTNYIMEKIMEKESINEIVETITSLMPEDDYDENYDYNEGML